MGPSRTIVGLAWAQGACLEVTSEGATT